MQDYLATQVEMCILDFLKNQMRETSAFSYQLPFTHIYHITYLEAAFKFLREKNYIEVEVVDENLFLNSIFKVKITSSGIEFFDNQLLLYAEQNTNNNQASLPQFSLQQSTERF